MLDENLKWNHICRLEQNDSCEYVCAHVEETHVNGFIRFKNPKCINSVNKIFNGRADTKPSQNNDNYYREIFFNKFSSEKSQTKQFFEFGTPAKNTKKIKTHEKPAEKSHLQELKEKNKKLEERLEEKNKIIDIVENQNEKLMQHSETLIEFINAFKDSRENDSEQIKQITNLCMTIAKNTPTTIMNNTTHNNFNLNVFLNEYCKDAVNIFDFVKSIQIELQDVILFKKIGHVEAVTQIFDNAYKNLEVKKRPMHCTDVKRETLYVKNDNKWVNDESKEISRKAMETISEKSFNKLKLWKEANPDYMTDDDKKQEYTLIMKQLIGGSSNRESDENIKKIIKNISRNTQINKESTNVVTYNSTN